LIFELRRSEVVVVNRFKVISANSLETELNKWYFYCVSAEETLTNYQYTVSSTLLQVISQTTTLSPESITIGFIFCCTPLC